MFKERKKITRSPKICTVVRPSKYELTAMIQANKQYWGNTFKELERKTFGPEIDSNQLVDVLTPAICKRVCKVLSLPLPSKKEDAEKSKIKSSSRLSSKEPLLTLRKSIQVERELDSDTEVEIGSSDEEKEQQPNVHLDLLKKPVREMISWPSRYLEPEKEEEKNLIKKADDLTNRISVEFCEFMTQLGGTQHSQFFTPNAIKDLFKIEFDTHAARGLRNITKELPCVPEKVAIATNHPEYSNYAALERQIAGDIKAEHTPNKIRGFNSNLKVKDRWIAPRNDTEKQWKNAQHVPKDLVTLKTVWEGITHLRSVKEYCRWMIENPQYKQAPYLKSLGMFDSAVLDARHTLELHRPHTPPSASTPRVVLPHNIPADIDDIRRKLSDLAEM